MNHNSAEPSKIYLGNLQEKSRLNGDKFLTGSLCLDDLENVPVEHIQYGKNGKRYLKVIINPYKNGANEYGNTHSVAVDTFKPSPQYRNFNVDEPVMENPEINYNKDKKVKEKEAYDSTYDTEFFKE